MMADLKQMTQSFQYKWDKFLIGCSAVQEEGKWDAERNGDMETFYSNDLISMILRLIAADGKITAQETEYLNDAFGFDYDTDELKDVWENCGDLLGDDFEERFRTGVARLEFTDEALAAQYRELLAQIAEIIVESDGVTAPEEIEAVNRLKAI